MTIVTTISVCLAIVCAFLLGRSVIISNRRLQRNKALKAEVKRLNHCLEWIAGCPNIDRYFEIDEDENKKVYNVNMKVYVCLPTGDGERVDTCCRCLIRQFPFDDDREFAKREAEELLDKLIEK